MYYTCFASGPAEKKDYKAMGHESNPFDNFLVKRA